MKTKILSAIGGLLFIFLILLFNVQLNSQVQKDFDDDYSAEGGPPHPDSLSELIEGIDIQFYNGGEAYVIKDLSEQAGKNINLPDAIELAKGFSDIYGSSNYAVPNGSTMRCPELIEGLTTRVFDTSIKPDASKLPPLAKTADTSLCNQIIWGEPMLLSEGTFFPNISVSGDTVHVVSSVLRVKNLLYQRSTNSGVEFEPLRNIYRDTVAGRAGGIGWTRVLSSGNKVFLIYFDLDTISTGEVKLYFAYTISKDGGNTFTPSRRIVDYYSFSPDAAVSGDTIAVVIGDNRWTRGAPVPMYIYISTNFGESWKFRGYAGGRRVYDPRIALAGGWLHQTNRYFPPGRWTRSEVAYYRSRVMRKTWSRRQVLSTNDGISSIQGDPVAEPNRFVGIIWGDGKYGSNYGVDGTPIFRRSLNFGKTFEPEVRLTNFPEAAWTVMKPKPIAIKANLIATTWAKWFEMYPPNVTNTFRISLDYGATWCNPSYYGYNPGGSGTTAVGNNKVYLGYEHTDESQNVGVYIVRGIIPPGLTSSNPLANGQQEAKEEKSSLLISQNYPNPFNPVTTINYEIAEPGFVTIKIYDVLGREISSLAVNEWKEEGEYEVEFSANDEYTSGIYFYRLSLKNDNGIKTKSGKMLLTK